MRFAFYEVEEPSTPKKCFLENKLSLETRAEVRAKVFRCIWKKLTFQA